MKPIEIPEEKAPKIESISFKLSKVEKEFIKEFCDLKGYRLSAAMRVLVLKGINKTIIEENL